MILKKKSGGDKKGVPTIVTLTLVLLVVTALLEKIFSVMNIVKNLLRNRIRIQ